MANVCFRSLKQAVLISFKSTKITKCSLHIDSRYIIWYIFSTSLLVHDMRGQSAGIHLWKNMIDRGLGMSVAFFCCIVLEPSIIWWIMRIFNAISRNLYCLSFCTCNKCALSWSFSFLRLISQSAPSTTWFCWTSFKLIRLECRLASPKRAHPRIFLTTSGFERIVDVVLHTIFGGSEILLLSVKSI